MDVDLREAGGVVVDDHLDCWNIQTAVKEHKVVKFNNVWRNSPRTQASCVKKQINLFAALRTRFIPRGQRLSLPSCHVCRNQNFVDAGLELGEVGKTLFLDEDKETFSVPAGL